MPCQAIAEPVRQATKRSTLKWPIATQFFTSCSALLLASAASPSTELGRQNPTPSHASRRWPRRLPKMALSVQVPGTCRIGLYSSHSFKTCPCCPATQRHSTKLCVRLVRGLSCSSGAAGSTAPPCSTCAHAQMPRTRACTASEAADQFLIALSKPAAPATPLRARQVLDQVRDWPWIQRPLSGAHH